MYLRILFFEWQCLMKKNAPDERKQKIAEQIQFLLQQDNPSGVYMNFTKNEQEVIKETKLFLTI